LQAPAIMRDPRVDRKGGSKIKGNGTSVALKPCLHVSFGDTRYF